LRYSIADGIGLGFITYALIKIASGHASRCPMAVYVVAGIFMLKFGFLS
jgi:AGZA family xanthine/uracil permease-like MFS transporter